MASILAGACVNANASAFQLFEYNGVNAEDFGAGAAAAATDASTAYSNPAGMLLIPNQQLVLSETAIITNIEYRGSARWNTNNSQVPLPLVHPGFSPTETGTAQGGGTNFVPAFHYVSPLSENWAFGFSLAAPFGLETNYGNSSVVRYSATKTELETIDLSPSLAFKATNNFSVGAGVDIEHLDATFNGVAGAPYVANAEGLSNSALDTQSINEGSGWGVGWHAGLLYQFNPATRVGLTYHSQVRFALDGNSKLTGPLANQGSVTSPGVVRNNNLHADITLPPSTELSAYHDFNQQWSIDGSIMYTQWSKFNNELRIQNVQGIAQASAISPLTYPQITVGLPNDFRNTWRFAIGANYHPIPKWIFRVGTGYDESPVRDQYRGVRLPDGDRYALALGAHYQALKTLGFDVGWTHLFIKNVNVNLNSTTGTQVANVTGSYKSSADIIGAQLTWDIT